MEDKHMRRAGLDYHEYAQVKRHANWADFLTQEKPNMSRMFALTTKGTRFVQETAFQKGDWLVFGAETRGLAPELRESFEPANRLKLPMLEGQRSLNLSNSVAVTVYEAWRQNAFAMPPLTQKSSEPSAN
jgi:tRNA (cytidine/uridine-2'-O-)-methyltransferase